MPSSTDPMIYAIHHDVPNYCPRSSFPPLLEQLDCRVINYRSAWEPLQKKSWTLGNALRRWGNRHFGSEWSWMVPYYHEWTISRKCKAGSGDVVHFMMGEFGGPIHPRWFNRRGARLVGTFHCSARRLKQVLGEYRCLFNYDRISVMSKTQIPFFVDRGYPADRIDVTLHGVDTAYFCPLETHDHFLGGNVNLLLVGSTERDHEFAAKVMMRLEGNPIHLDVLTSPVNRGHYQGLPNVGFLSGLSDEELIAAYRKADVLFMPMLDCTANNAIMEAMACGTPVMVNRVGGMPEYVDASCNFMMDEKNVEQWVERLSAISDHRDELIARRSAVREWAEKMDWSMVKQQYLDFYEAALSASPRRN